MPHNGPNLGKDCPRDLWRVVPCSSALCAMCHPPTGPERDPWSHRWLWFPATAVQFVKLIFCFGYPHSIITDNGTNLSKGAMKEFCQREHIRLDVSFVAHP